MESFEVRYVFFFQGCIQGFFFRVLKKRITFLAHHELPKTPFLEDGLPGIGSVVNWPMVCCKSSKDRVGLDPFQMAYIFMAEINGG